MAKPSEKEADFKLVHEAKALSPSETSPLENAIAGKLEHLANAFPPMVTRLAGGVITAKEMQSEKAL